MLKSLGFSVYLLVAQGFFHTTIICNYFSIVVCKFNIKLLRKILIIYNVKKEVIFKLNVELKPILVEVFCKLHFISSIFWSIERLYKSK